MIRASALLAVCALLASCNTPSARQTQVQEAQAGGFVASALPASPGTPTNRQTQARIQESPTRELVAICDLDASMTNLSASLFADEDLVPTSASERRKKLQEQIRKLSVVKTLPNVSREVRAEALFWCAETYFKLGDQRTAYRMFKELAWEYPDTKWGHGHHRLSDPALVRLERTMMTNTTKVSTSSNVSPSR